MDGHRITLEIGGSNPPTTDQQTQIRAALGVTDPVPGSGSVTTTDASTRAALAPEALGQPLWQQSDNTRWYGTALTPGAWAIIAGPSVEMLAGQTPAVLTPSFVGQMLFHSDPAAPVWYIATGATLGAWSPINSAAVAGPNFAVEGFTPGGTLPTDAIMRHLSMVDSKVVYVDYPGNITAAGLTHQEVILAALALFPAGSGGSWQQDGTVRLQTGTYQLKDSLLWRARLNLEGAHGCSYQNGTVLEAIAGGDLESGDETTYVVEVRESDDVNFNGNFTQHFRDIRIEPNAYTSGLKWGGAQCSSLKNVHVVNPHVDGFCFHIGGGTNGALIENCWAAGTNPGGSTSARVGFLCDSYSKVTFVSCKCEWLGIGHHLGAGDFIIIGQYAESMGVLVLNTGTVGMTRCIGMSVHNMAADGGTGKYHLFEFPDGYKNFEAEGTLRSIEGADIVYQRSGVTYPVLPGGTTGAFDLYKLDLQEPDPVTGLTALAGGGNGGVETHANVIEVSVVASPGDSVKLSSASQRTFCRVINNGVNDMSVYPRVGQDLGLGVDIPANFTPGTDRIFHRVSATAWM